VIYFFDNNISPRYAEMLRALGVNVTALSERFPPNIKDEDFLPQLKDCILITGDQRIRTRKIEAAALRQSGISALFLARFWPRLVLWDQARWLVTRWPDIDRFTSRTSMGTYAEVQQGGTIRLIDV